MIKHHTSGKDHRDGIDNRWIQLLILGSGSMGRLKNSNLRTDIGTAGKAQPTNQTGKSIRYDVSEHIPCNNYIVCFRILSKPHHLGINVSVVDINIGILCFCKFLCNFQHHTRGFTDHIGFFANSNCIKPL